MQKQQYQAEQQQVTQQANNNAQKRSTYNGAYTACPEGKGYMVK